MKNSLSIPSNPLISLAVAVGITIASLFIISDLEERKTNFELEVSALRMKNAQLEDSVSNVNARLAEIYKLTWDNIDYWIEAFGIKNADIVKAQIYEETGNLTSQVCRSNHNLFGMKLPAVRETSAIGSRNGFAYYGNYIESIQDYALWQRSMYTYSDEDYYDFLVRVGYCHPDGVSYVKRLKYIQKNVDTNY